MFKLQSLCLALSLVGSPIAASAQDINQLGQATLGLAHKAMTIRRAKSAWKRLASGERACIQRALERDGQSIQQLSIAGVGPSDSSLSDIRSICRNNEGVTDQGAQSVYSVDGLALGDHVRFGSAAYRSYKCVASELEPNFQWCTRSQRQGGGRERHTATTSILHRPDGKVVYISQTIRPARLDESSVEAEIARLSKRFGVTAEKIELKRDDVPRGVIASWGDVALEPLDDAANSALKSGESPKAGLLIDFVGDFTKSAKRDLPIYRLSNGPGFVWSASFNSDGLGHLRFLAVDSRGLESNTSRLAQGVEIKTSDRSDTGFTSAANSAQDNSSATSVAPPSVSKEPEAAFADYLMQHAQAATLASDGDVSYEFDPKSPCVVVFKKRKSWNLSGSKVKKTWDGKIVGRYPEEIKETVDLRKIDPVGFDKDPFGQFVTFDSDTMDLPLRMRFLNSESWEEVSREEANQYGVDNVVLWTSSEKQNPYVFVAHGRWTGDKEFEPELVDVLHAVMDKCPRAALQPDTDVTPQVDPEPIASQPGTHGPYEPDLVAQVLNYTTTGDDKGSNIQRWVPVGECKYKLQFIPLKNEKKQTDVEISSALLGLEGTVDLNSLDPKALKFKVRDNDAANREVGFAYFSPGGVSTHVLHDGNSIMWGPGRRDLDRLVRGWQQIFDNHCDGRERPF